MNKPEYDDKNDRRDPDQESFKNEENYREKYKSLFQSLQVSLPEFIFVVGLAIFFLLFGYEGKFVAGDLELGSWMLIFPLTLGIWLTFRPSEWAVHGLDAGTKYLRQTDYVAGVISSLASNLPEAVLAYLFITSGTENGVLIGVVSILAAAGFNTLLFAIVVIAGSLNEEGGFEVKEETIFQELVLMRWAFVAIFVIVIVGIIEHIQFLRDKIATGEAAISQNPNLPRLAALLLGVSYLVYLFNLIIAQRKIALKKNGGAYISQPSISKTTTVLLLLLGFIGIALGGKIIEQSIHALLEHYDLKPLLVALILGGAGSIPEHGIALLSARKEKIDVAIGNTIGGILQTTLLLLGFFGLITNIPLEPFILIQLAATASVLWFIKVSIQNDHRLDLYEGTMILLLQLFIFLLFIFDITTFT